MRQFSVGSLRLAVRAELDGTRARTLRLLHGLPDADVQRQPSPVVSPPAWDLGHVAWFEDQWLVARLGAEPVSAPGAARLYDAEVQPRPGRGGLALADRQGCLRYLAEVRTAALRVLAGLDLEAEDPLLRGGFVHRMIVNHEAQHQENMLHSLARMPRYRAPREAAAPRPRQRVGGMVRVPAGPFPLGRDLEPGVYDNEAPAHEVDVPEFWIDAAPVTNGDFLRFVEAGGYHERGWWSEDGWELRGALRWEHPLDWQRAPQGWARRSFDTVALLAPDEPVMHVSWYEAEAYARWAGKRLPTEPEWEKACAWDPVARRKLPWPWGDAPWSPERANLGQRLFQPAPVGSYPGGRSPVGCHQMLGDVWEWTASELGPYPGFKPFPYAGYSVPWMRGGWFVLRGGSWATSPSIARPTFRNWAQPDHRHIFAGFRCARSEAPEGA